MNDQLTAQGLATKLLFLLKQKEIAEERVKTFNKEIFKFQQKLLDAMGEEDVTAIEIEGVKFGIKDDVNFSMQNTNAEKWADCPEFVAWLKTYGDEGIIKQVPTIHPQTLKKYLKDKLEEGESFPSFIKTTEFSRVNWNKSLVARIARQGAPSE